MVERSGGQAVRRTVIGRTVAVSSLPRQGRVAASAADRQSAGQKDGAYALIILPPYRHTALPLRPSRTRPRWPAADPIEALRTE